MTSNKLSQVFVTGRTGLSQQFKHFLDKYGNNQIKGLMIVRNPIKEVATQFFKTFGNVPYDKLFHLQLWLTLDNSKTVMVEKNHTLNGDDQPRTTADNEIMQIDHSLVPNITLNELMHNTASLMGKHFIQYHPEKANCQSFIISILKANGINESNYNEFIQQDAQEIFKNHPNLRKLSATITQVVDRGHLLIGQGVKKENKWIQHVKQYSKDNNVSYKDAIKLAKDSYHK